MKYAFSHYLLTVAMSSAMLIGYTACSDDESGNSTGPSQQPFDESSELPTITSISPIVPTTLNVRVNGDGTLMLIEGGAKLDLLDTTAIPTGAEINFTSAKLILAKITETGEIVKSPLTIANDSVTGPVPNINWGQYGASITDNNKADCGSFRVYAVYNASYDSNIPNMYVSIDSTNFVRDQSFCEVIPETPTQTPEQIAAESVELVSAVVNLGTKSSEGLSLATATTVPTASADIVFISDDLTGKISMYTQNGVQVTPYSNNRDKNYDDDWTINLLPPAPAHMSDFRFKKGGLTTSSDFESFMFYVAIGANYNAETGDGFYAFTLQSKSDTPDANGNYALSILMFKKK